MSEPGCLRLPLAHYPGFSPFVLDWLAGQPRATPFLGRSVDADLTGLSSRRPRSAALASALEVSNRRWGIFAGEQLRRWAAGEGVTLVAGQQVGFAGGPLYTLAKLATLVKMKRRLESAGVAATAFFWLATEDHDFDEVARLSLPISMIGRDEVSRQLDLLTIRATRTYESKRVVGPIPIPEALITELLALYELPRPPWLREGITFGDSFAELIAAVFGSEVVLADALLPELRRAGAELFGRINGEWTAMQDALRARAGELRAAGYEPQVLPREDGDYTLLFEIDGRGDRRIVESPRALDPERASTSALTRPLLQDFVLRPDVFVGGPAEVAYYAQLSPLHDLLQIEMPRVALRGHVLVAPKRVVRFVGRLGIKPEELFTSADEMLAAREPGAVAEVRRLAAEGERDLMEKIERIGQLALPAEHSLARAITRSIGHIEYHFSKLAGRAIKGIARKDRERWSAARELLATLCPDGKVQDRVVAWFPFWHLHGRHLVDRVVEEIDPDTDAFKVISI